MWVFYTRGRQWGSMGFRVTVVDSEKREQCQSSVAEAAEEEKEKDSGGTVQSIVADQRACSTAHTSLECTCTLRVEESLAGNRSGFCRYSRTRLFGALITTHSTVAASNHLRGATAPESDRLTPRVPASNRLYDDA